MYSRNEDCKKALQESEGVSISGSKIKLSQYSKGILVYIYYTTVCILYEYIYCMTEVCMWIIRVIDIH